MENIEFHPLADLFPLIYGKDFVELKVDIERQGLIEPIWLLDGQILDGRNRFRACQEVGVEPSFRDYLGDAPAAFVWSLNGPRRHLDSGQKAAIAVELLPHLEKEARARQERGINQHSSLTEIIPEPSAGESRQQAAEMVGTNPRYVSDAKKLKEDFPEVFEQVKAGEISLPQAKRETTIATLHTGDEESYTPGIYIESARKVMGTIDMDPASNTMAQETVKAGTFYTVDDDGLTKDWVGNVWMNPPYTARVINKFIEKFVEDFSAGEISQGLILTNNNTDTSWFHIGASYASAICFTAGRINFLKRDGSKSSPTNGQLFFYFGNNVAAFKDEFCRHGLVMVKA